MVKKQVAACSSPESGSSSEWWEGCWILKWEVQAVLEEGSRLRAQQNCRNWERWSWDSSCMTSQNRWMCGSSGDTPSYSVLARSSSMSMLLEPHTISSTCRHENAANAASGI